jgi:hypothetical protein
MIYQSFTPTGTAVANIPGGTDVVFIPHERSVQFTLRFNKQQNNRHPRSATARGPLFFLSLTYRSIICA